MPCFVGCFAKNIFGAEKEEKEVIAAFFIPVREDTNRGKGH
jgi:hypothetical protein